MRACLWYLQLNMVNKRWVEKYSEPFLFVTLFLNGPFIQSLLWITQRLIVAKSLQKLIIHKSIQTLFCSISQPSCILFYLIMLDMWWNFNGVTHGDKLNWFNTVLKGTPVYEGSDNCIKKYVKVSKKSKYVLRLLHVDYMSEASGQAVDSKCWWNQLQTQ